jgi:hypothetical protein
LFTSWSPEVGRGHNREKHICMCLYSEKKIFSRTSRPFSIKLCTNHPWVKGILNYTIKGMYLFKGEIIIKLQKFGEVINFFLENH